MGLLKIYGCSEGNKIMGYWVHIVCYCPCPHLNFTSKRPSPWTRPQRAPIYNPIFVNLISGLILFVSMLLNFWWSTFILFEIEILFIMVIGVFLMLSRPIMQTISKKYALVLLFNICDLYCMSSSYCMCILYIFFCSPFTSRW